MLRKEGLGVLAASSAAALMAAVFAIPVQAAEVTQQRLENADAEPQNWLTALGNYSAHRYSRLDQVNRDSVAGLRLAFTMPMPTALKGTNVANLEGPPLVVDGMMYVNDVWGTVYKVDVTDGKTPKILWVADPAIPKDIGGGLNATRGIAVFGNRVFANLIDGRAVAFDGETGEIVWDQKIGGQEADWDFDAAEGFTAAPLAVDGKILVGQSKGDWGTRGYLAALSADDGKELWRTYTIPGPGEPGHETWADDHNAWRTGGGSLWQTGAYDPAQRITIWGTANPVPMFDPEFRPGDNLYTNSALAFNIDDGKIAWYFQYTPNESWDYDEIGVHMLYDATVDGEPRKVVAHFARNGFYYQLDRTNGAFIGAAQFVNKVTWTAGIDPKTGKPVEYDPSKQLQTYIPATRQRRADQPTIAEFCPTFLGGVRWQPPAFNPDTQTAYVVGVQGCSGVTVEVEEPLAGGGNPNGVNQFFLGGKDFKSIGTPRGLIAAFDVTNRTMKQNLEVPYHIVSGALATSGGLLFTGHLDGTLAAYNSDSLEELWTFNTGISLKAPPIAYAVGDKQFIAILAGGDPAPGGLEGYRELSTMKEGATLYVFSL